MTVLSPLPFSVIALRSIPAFVSLITLRSAVATFPVAARMRIAIIESMGTTVDMTYRFLWDSEPTDEQLLVIMQEVAEDVRRSREQVAQQMIETLEREYANAIAARNTQQQ